MIARDDKDGCSAAGPLWIGSPPPPDSSPVAAAGYMTAAPSRTPQANDHGATAFPVPSRK